MTENEAQEQAMRTQKLASLFAEITDSIQTAQDLQGGTLRPENADFYEQFWIDVKQDGLLGDFQLLCELNFSAFVEDFEPIVMNLVSALRRGEPLGESPPLDPWSYLMKEHSRLKQAGPETVTQEELTRLSRVSAYTLKKVRAAAPSATRVAEIDNTDVIRQVIDDFQRIAPEELLEDYEVIKKIGRGSQAEVYLAREKELDRLVAIKVFKNGSAGFEEDATEDRPETEAKNQASLNHPNIVTVYRTIRKGDRLFLVQEYLSRGNLQESIENSGFFSRADIVRFGSALAAALEYAHFKDLIHRDIKSSNILLSEDAQPKICDFGISRKTSKDGKAKATLAGTAIGTPEFMSPEQTRADSLTAKSDQYSFGVVLYHMAAAQPPFVDPNDDVENVVQMVRHQEPAPIGDIGIGEDLWQIIKRMLAKDPEDRFETMTEVREALQNLPDDQKAPESRPASRVRVLTAVLLAVGAVAFLLHLLGFPYGVSSPRKNENSIANKEDAENTLDDPDKDLDDKAENTEGPEKKDGPTEKKEPEKKEGAGNLPAGKELPYIKEGPPNHKPSPSKEESTEALFDTYAPTPKDAGHVRALLAIYDQHHPHIRSFQYKQAINAVRAFRTTEDLTEFADFIAESIERQLLLCQQLYKAKPYSAGTKATIVVAGDESEKKTLTGTVIKVSAKSLLLQLAGDQEALEIPLTSVHPETYVLGADTLDQVLFLATHGSTTEAGALFFEHMDRTKGDFNPQLLPHTPGILHAAALGTLIPLDRGNRKPANAFKDLVRNNWHLLPSSLRRMINPEDSLDYELAAATLFHNGDHAAVLVEYPQSRFTNRASAALLSAFRKSVTADTMWKAEALAWKRTPDRIDRAKRVELTHPKTDEKRWFFLLSAAGDQQAIRRDLPGSRDGLTIRFGFQTKAKNASFSIAFAHPDQDHLLQLDLDGIDLVLRRAASTDRGKDKELARHTLPELPKEIDLTVIRARGRILIYLESSLLFQHETTHVIGPSIHLGVRGANMLIHHLKIAKDE